jgi:branched-chain amino acid transport system permease protein
MANVLLTIWSGLVLGAVYASVAFGFSMSMLPSGVFNFAQGAIVVAGTYLTYGLLGHRAGVAPVLVLDVTAGAVLGTLCEIVCVRTLRRAHPSSAQQNELVTTIGISTAIVGALGLRWGYLPKSVPFVGPSTSIHFFGVIAQPDQILLVAGAIVTAVALHLWFHRTRLGQACLAVAEDRPAASLRGINVEMFSVVGFAAAGAFGMLSATAIGPITYALPALANTIALGGFVAIALGGSGNFLGSLIGGLTVGTVSSVTTRYIGGNYADLVILSLLLLVLLVRPSGLGARVAMRSV